jgi:malonyl-CoA O-methyltransferase
MSSPVAEKSVNASGGRLDRKSVRRAFDRATSSSGDERAVAAEIARRMAERLDYVRLEPRHILDAGCGRVPAGQLLAKRFPDARLTGVDSSLSMAQSARRPEPLLARVKLALGIGANPIIVCGDMESLPIASASVDMVWSNLALAWAQDAGVAFHEFHRVLKEGGLLMFSTYGPDTLRELRSAFAAAERGPHVHEFADMHDLGDMLLANGFAEPVMDMEKLVCTYAEVAPMVRELRQSGQTNAVRDRRRGLMGRSVWNAMLAAYARRKEDGRIAATFEIVYGHAWKVGRRPRASESSGSAATIQWSPERNRKR